MRKLLLAIIGLLIAAPAIAQVTLGTTNPPYGWTVMTKAQRTVAVYPSGAGATTKKINWSVSGGATLSCTTNCPPVTTVTITAAGGTCSVTGSVGSYVFHSTSDVILTATSVDDPTKTATIPFHVCDTTGSAYVDVEPTYNQAFQGQKKTLQSYVIGYTNENVTWSILSQPSGGDGAFTDTIYRDTQFSATVTGRYVLKATSSANSGLSATAIIYVSPNALPRTVTPNKTEPTECYVDPALTGTDYEVGPSRAFTTLKSIGTVGWTGTGAIVRIHNDDTTGHAPTTYHEVMQIQGTGTATQPMYFCGVADSAGNLPVIDGSNATEDPLDSPYLVGAGAFKFVYTNSNYGLGFEVGSTGPDYVGITGIRIQNLNNNFSYYPNGSPTLTPYTGGSGIYLRAGRHVHYEGLDMNNVGWGVIANNNTTYTGSSMTMFHQMMGSHISNFSDTNSYSEHALYMEAFYTLIENNLIENPTALDNGNFMKVRGGSAIIRYNALLGQLSGNTIAFPDMEDTFQFVSVDDNLGPVGGGCGASVWCTITTNNITIPHLIQNEEALAHDYVYGNILSNPNANGFNAIQYGSDSAPTECPPCTNMSDRQGRLYFWNNTVDKPTDAVITSTNPYTGSYFAPLPQYSFRTTSIYNNVFWNAAASPFFLNVDTTAIYTLQTNMYPTGVMSLTPTTGGSGGWGNFTGPYAYPLSVPISGHMTGLTSGNFLTTGTLPYNGTTFVPISGSPLIGAGGTIADPEISGMPVRSQPNVASGFVTARTAGASTIGAEENGAPPTTVVNPTCIPGSGTYTSSQSVTCSSTTPSSTTYCTINGTTPTSSSPVCTSIAVASTLTLQAISEASGLTNSSVVSNPYTITPPTVANPTFSPVAGTYFSSQSVVIGTTTSGASIVYTADGSTPSVSSGCTIIHGTLYAGAVTVAASQTLKALGCKAASTASGVSSAAYVISPTFNVNNTMSQATIQAAINTADATSGNTVVFAAGTYPGANVGGLQWKCANGTIYTGPANSAGYGPGSNNQWGPITTNAPAVLNSDNTVSGSGSITSIQGGNSSHTTPGSGCTIQNLTFANDSALVAGGDWASNNPSYGILFQNNTCKSLTNNGNGSTCLFVHDTIGFTMQNNYCTAAAGAYSGTGCYSVAQNTTNVIATNNYCGTIGQCFGSSFDYTSGFTNVSITNNVIKDIARLGWEFVNGNSPGIASGLTITGNLYIDPVGDPYISPFSGAVSMATGNFSNPGSSGFTYHITDNVFAANTSFNTSGGNHMFYCFEGTSGSASTFLRNLCQGNWPAAPAVAVGNVTGALDLSNTIAQGSFLTSSGAAIGCEYSGTIPNCGFSSGGTIPGPITANSLTTGTTPIQQTSTAPSISPASGAFSSPPTVTISNTQSNVTNFCTTDGSTPTTASAIMTSYTPPTLPATIKCLSQWGTGAATAYPFPSGYGWGPSSVTSVTYTLPASTVANPTYAPPAGTYGGSQSVAIATSTPSASVVYTNDGTTPTVTSLTCTITNGTLYTGPVTVSASQTLNALGCLTGNTASSVVSAAYIITVAVPTFSPSAGSYGTAQSVSISTATSGASVIYTNDGSAPTVSSGCTITNGTLYAGALTISTSQTLKAIGCKAGLSASSIASAAYLIGAKTGLTSGIQINGSGVIFK